MCRTRYVEPFTSGVYNCYLAHDWGSARISVRVFLELRIGLHRLRRSTGCLYARDGGGGSVMGAYCVALCLRVACVPHSIAGCLY